MFWLMTAYIFLIPAYQPGLSLSRFPVCLHSFQYDTSINLERHFLKLRCTLSLFMFLFILLLLLFFMLLSENQHHLLTASGLIIWIWWQHRLFLAADLDPKLEYGQCIFWKKYQILLNDNWCIINLIQLLSLNIYFFTVLTWIQLHNLWFYSENCQQ